MFIETSAKTGCNVKQVISAVSPYFRAFWSSLDGRFTFRFKMCNTDNHIWCTLYSVLLTHFTLVGGYIEFKSRRLSKLHIAIEDHNIHHLKFNYCLPQYSELYTGLVTHIFTHFALLLITLFPPSLLFPPYLSILSSSLSPSRSCFVELLQPYLEWKAWTTQILKAVSFIATMTHGAESQAATNLASCF